MLLLVQSYSAVVLQMQYSSAVVSLVQCDSGSVVVVGCFNVQRDPCELSVV